MDDLRPPAGVLLDVVPHVPADGDDRRAFLYEPGPCGVGVPAGRAEREELRRVGEIDHPSGRRPQRLAELQLAEVLGRHQHPIRLEAVNLLAQHAAPQVRLRGGVNQDRAAAHDLNGVHFAGFESRNLNLLTLELFEFAGAIVGQIGGDDAALVTGGRKQFEPDQVTAGGAAPRRHVRRVGGQKNAHGSIASAVLGCLGLLLDHGAHLLVGEPLDFRQDIRVLSGAGLLDQPDFNGLGQFRHREGFRVDDVEGKVDVVGLPHTRQQLHRQQGMAAEVEEVVIDADGGYPQQFGPQRGKLPLEIGPWRG